MDTRQRKITSIDGPIDANTSYTFVENIGFVGMKGDINNDDIINIQDIIIFMNYVLSDTLPDEDALFWSVDMNYDNVLNVLDVVRLINKILN